MDNLDKHLHVSIRHLTDQVGHLKHIKKKLDQIIAPEIAEFIQVAKINKQTLILMAESASFATHIKMIAPEMVEALNKIAPELIIKEIKCKVSTPRGALKRPVDRTATPISQASADNIKSVASGIKHERLKLALEKLCGQAK